MVDELGLFEVIDPHAYFEGRLVAVWPLPYDWQKEDRTAD